MSPAIVTAVEDRWIVNARHRVVSDLSARPSELRIELDSGLFVEVTGPWRATTGSPITGGEVDPKDLDRMIGSEILSLVLFATGSIRIVLSTGVTIVVKAEDSTRVRAALADRFSWAADGHSVTHWLADANSDG